MHNIILIVSAKDVSEIIAVIRRALGELNTRLVDSHQVAYRSLSNEDRKALNEVIHQVDNEAFYLYVEGRMVLSPGQVLRFDNDRAETERDN